MSDCFECHGSGVCGCITCRESKGCVVCKARAFWDAFRPTIARIDIRERRHWRLMRPEAPAHPHRVLIPEEQFRKQQEEIKQQLELTR